MSPKVNLITLFLFLVIIFNVFSRANCELFTATYEVERLLETHKRIIDDLDFFIENEETRIRMLKNNLNYFKTEHEKAMEDIPNYLGNPINAFTLIKRLTADIYSIENGIKISTEYIKNMTMSQDDAKYPTVEDLNGAAQALTRLKKTYRLQIDELAEGIFNGIVYSTPMSASDCFELGRALFNEKDFDSSLEWMMVALRKLKETGENVSFTEVDILEYIAYSHYSLGRPKTALEWTERLLAIDPNHVQTHRNVHLYKKAIEEEEAQRRSEREDQRGDTGKLSQDHVVKGKRTEYDMYTSLCRGEMEINSAISKRLKCWYMTENHPFLKYAPIKVEQSYIQPDIFIFHEVMSDNEIETIKTLAMPRFQRALVSDYNTGNPVATDVRISKSSWLWDYESEIVARVSRRVSDMTGLSMLSAEPLQVGNYGIGGHYEPHYDFSLNREKLSNEFEGNRIATILFYMSDVAQGGATVFTELGLSLFPIKGAAAFWLNLHPSGEGDLATKHAACPVLRGSKWVSNKWLHQRGQELIRPCNLQFQPEGMIRQPLPPQPATAY